VIVAGQILGRLLRFMGQPPVIGEVVAGIALGPSLLGWVAPDVYSYILPPTVAPLLDVIAQLGVILYMFVLGLELNTEMLRGRARSTLIISQSSIAVPFVLGTLLAYYLYPRLSEEGVPFTSFSLFLGVAMAITAFPVLARILTDRKIHQSRLGVVALSCAAMNDVAAWCLLALVSGIAQAKVGGSLLVLAWTAAFIIAMLLIVKPLALRLAKRAEGGDPSKGIVTIVFIALLVSALTAEWIGIHAIFGAFLLGAIIPYNSAIARTFTSRLEDLVTVVFLPAFFASTGMRSRIDLVSGPEEWLLCGIIILVATLGKFGGTLVAARLTGRGWREAASLAALMNTRGLMELIVLNVGLDLQIISPKLFAMMVVMAVVTTLATTPVLQLLARGRRTGPNDFLMPANAAEKIAANNGHPQDQRAAESPSKTG